MPTLSLLATSVQQGVMPPTETPGSKLARRKKVVSPQVLSWQKEQEKETARPVTLVVVGVVGLVVGAVLGWLIFGSTTKAHVNGRVTLDGEPLSRAQVVFLLVGGKQGPLVASTGDSGEYRLIGHTGGGITPGKYKVTVTKMALKDGTLPQGEALNQAREKGLLKNLLPTIYAEAEKTPLEFELRAGYTSLEIPLKKQP